MDLCVLVKWKLSILIIISNKELDKNHVIFQNKKMINKNIAII